MNRRTLLKSILGLVVSIPFMALERGKPAVFLGVDRAGPAPDETRFIYRIPTGKLCHHTILPLEDYAEVMDLGNLLHIVHLPDRLVVDIRYENCKIEGDYDPIS